jgi:hypothetical protein
VAGKGEAGVLRCSPAKGARYLPDKEDALAKLATLMGEIVK